MNVHHNGVWLGGGTHRPSREAEPPANARVRPIIPIREDSLAERLRYERQHEPGVQLANAERSEELAAMRAAAAGRCHNCAELIGEVTVCPVCGTPQATSGRRNGATRRAK